MKIRYTLHALERLRQRGIKRELVEHYLKNPDKDEEINDLRRCTKKLNDRVIVVVYKQVNDTLIVITAYITTKNLQISLLNTLTNSNENSTSSSEPINFFPKPEYLLNHSTFRLL